MERQETPTNVQEGVPKGVSKLNLCIRIMSRIQLKTNILLIPILLSLREFNLNMSFVTCLDPPQNLVKGGVAKELGSFASSSGNKRKNKPSKKKRDALKKKNVVSEVEGTTPVTGGTAPAAVMLNSDVSRGNKDNGICKKFILVDNNYHMIFTPLGVQINTLPSREPTNVTDNICTLNTDPVLPSSTDEFDKYAMVNSEDEVDGDNLSINKDDEDDAITEQLIRAFIPSHDEDLQNEIQQVSWE